MLNCKKFLLAVLLLAQPLCGAELATLERTMDLDDLDLEKLEFLYEKWQKKEQEVYAEFVNIMGIAKLANDDDDVYGFDHIDREKRRLVKELVKVSLERNEIRERIRELLACDEDSESEKRDRYRKTAKIEVKAMKALNFD